MRAALYWVPEPGDPLLGLGNAWLGRDAELAAPVPQPAIEGLPALTADPRRYGLHATLRPPMRLRGAWRDFEQAAERIAAGTPPFAPPPLRVTNLDGFLALTLAAPCAPLRTLADLCVTATNPHRAPPRDEELARRRAANLSPRQEELLTGYGYPYVLDEWHFHMTLTRRLDGATLPRLLAAAEAHFNEALGVARRVESLCICTEAEPGADLLIARRVGLGACW